METFSVGRVVVAGLSVGRAFLDVATVTGLTDSIGLSVDEIADSEILLLPWTAWLRLPDSLWAEGTVLLPDSPLEVFVRHQNDDGTVLTGYGATAWEISAAAEASITPGEGSDFATVRSGEALEVFTISTAGEEVELETVEESAVTSLEIYNKTDESGPFADGATMQLQADHSYLLHLAAFTDNSEYVIGSGETPLVAIVPAEHATELEVSLSPTSQDDEAVNEVLNYGRAFFVDAKLTGTATLTVEWADLSVTITVEILPPDEANETDGTTETE